MVDNLVMSEQVSLGFSGGPTFATDTMVTISGQERRLQNRALAVHAYTFAYEDQPASVVVAAKAFFYDRRGDFKAFLFKDHGDYSATGSVLGTGDGAATTFQITKTYTGGSNPYVRTIRHIRDGMLTVYLDGVAQVLTTDYTVSSTGLITFVGAPTSAAVVTADFEFYVPVRFDGDTFNSAIPHRALDAMSVADLSVIEVIP